MFYVRLPKNHMSINHLDVAKCGCGYACSQVVDK